MVIGDIKFSNNLILAPMAGVTDVAFRSICVECGADAGVSELISAKALVYGNAKTRDMLHTATNEKIKIIQIFGNDPDIMAKACTLPELDKFDIIDINMGCPVPKVVNNGEGSALMLDMCRAKAIIEACVKATTKPITVKFRKGWDDEHVNCVEFAKMCEEAGAKAVTIHGRTRNKFYSGKADWSVIAEVKKAVKIPVIASGDVVDKITFDEVIKQTNCDAVMVGRGALGNPEVFSEILGLPTKNKIDYIRQHVEILRQFYPERFIVAHMRKHFLWYLKGVRGANPTKVFVSTSNDVDKSIEAVDEILKNTEM